MLEFYLENAHQLSHSSSENQPRLSLGLFVSALIMLSQIQTHALFIVGDAQAHGRF